MRSFVPLPTAKAALIRQLSRHKKIRDVEQAFVMEGVKPIRELLNSHSSSILTIVVRSTFIEKVDPVFRKVFTQSAVPVYLCRDVVFDQLSDLSTPPGILALVRQPVWDQAALLKRPGLLGFYGEDLQDPANVGAIIRTALAFDMDALWLSTESADVFNPKVVRSTAGALLRLPIFSIPNVLELNRHGCKILASERPGGASVPIHDIPSLPPRAVIALGNESRGLSDPTLKEAFLRFHIPVSRLVNSLNVAAVAAISVFYFRGLRNSQSRPKFR